MLVDSHGRQIKDLRISVTDRCNFRCTYCKALHGHEHVHRSELLTYEEIERIARILLNQGVSKIRLTGGEPMLRKDLEILVRKLSKLDGLKDLALTTNGYNLGERAKSLKLAGLHRVTVSLDSLNEDHFHSITSSKDHRAVLRGIDAAVRHDLSPVKINCVVVKNVNDSEILDFVEFARFKNLTVRFIEFMPLDEDENWSRDKVVTGEQILSAIRSRYELVENKPKTESQTATTFGFPDSKAKIGLITTVSDPFCNACSRIRLTADGKIRNCLFANEEYEIKTILREDSSDEEILMRLKEIIDLKEQGHKIDQPDFVAPARSMSYIGG